MINICIIAFDLNIFYYVHETYLSGLDSRHCQYMKAFSIKTFASEINRGWVKLTFQLLNYFNLFNLVT